MITEKHCTILLFMEQKFQKIWNIGKNKTVHIADWWNISVVNKE